MSPGPAQAGHCTRVHRACAHGAAAWGRSRAAALFVTMASVALTGCVTTYETAPLFSTKPEPPPEVSAVTIPIGSGSPGDSGAVAEFYRSVLLRMHEVATAREPDLPQLEGLLARYDRGDLPASLVAALGSYRVLAQGMRCLQQLQQQARLDLVPADDGGVTLPPAAALPVATRVPPIGAPLRFELRIPAGAEPIHIGGRDDDDVVAFAVSITIDDTHVSGLVKSSSTQQMVCLPVACDLQGSVCLRLPIALDAPGGDAVRRSVRVGVDLLPGFLRSGEMRAPVRRTRLTKTSITQYPDGYEEVSKAPFAQLQAALRVFGPRDFARAYLAALATHGDDRERAIGLLVDQVRFGRVDQAQVAMAALQEITDAGVPIGDREGWLAWWQRRR